MSEDGEYIRTLDGRLVRKGMYISETETEEEFQKSLAADLERLRAEGKPGFVVGFKWDSLDLDGERVPVDAYEFFAERMWRNPPYTEEDAARLLQEILLEYQEYKRQRSRS